ncbi:MAG: hypothetical protein KC413_17205, partial [Anaerolineales bacterium]|nr:hypothetical protein [Anaerolineales bacterium]
MTHRKIFTRSLILLCSLLFTAVPHLFAQAPTITRNDATLDFPDSVTFHLELSSSTDIEQATLIYDLNQYTCLDVPSRVPVDVTGDVLEWQWVLSRSGNPPPGAELWWQWELVTRSGETITTPRQTLAFTDDRFAWQVVSANGIHVHWYKGEDVGPILLDAAVSGLQTLENDMGIELQS